jgi:plastocyanin
VTVSAGTFVRWINRGNRPHTVVVGRGPTRFRSKSLQPGQTYNRIVTRGGTYKIHCSIHGAKDQSMILRVT